MVRTTFACAAGVKQRKSRKPDCALSQPHCSQVFGFDSFAAARP